MPKPTDINGGIKLKKNKTIDGIPCKSGIIRFDENGKLRKATLSRDITIDGIPCKANTVVYVNLSRDVGYPALTQAVLSKNTIIQGVPCKGGELVFFDAIGSLYFSTLWEDATIYGTPSKAGTSIKLKDSLAAEELFHKADVADYAS